MAGLLIEARDAAATARLARQAALDPAILDDLLTRYRALAAAGLAASLYCRTVTAEDAHRLAGRFLAFEDLILRFATPPDLDIFTRRLRDRRVLLVHRPKCGITRLALRGHLWKPPGLQPAG
jgi:hypothetical protein